MSNSSPGIGKRLLASHASRRQLFQESWGVLLAAFLIVVAVGGGFAITLTRGLQSASWWQHLIDQDNRYGSRDVRDASIVPATPLKGEQCKRSILDPETGYMIEIIRPCGDIVIDADSAAVQQGANRWKR
jgi:hypothetical protein